MVSSCDLCRSCDCAANLQHFVAVLQRSSGRSRSGRKDSRQISDPNAGRRSADILDAERLRSLVPFKVLAQFAKGVHSNWHRKPESAVRAPQHLVGSRHVDGRYHASAVLMNTHLNVRFFTLIETIGSDSLTNLGNRDRTHELGFQIFSSTTNLLARSVNLDNGCFKCRDRAIGTSHNTLGRTS